MRDCRESLGLLVAVCFAALLAAPASGATPLVFRPVDDGTINARAPRHSYGDATRLWVSRHPRRVAYLKFVVSGLSGAPTDARLRLWALSTSDERGVDVRTVPSRRWHEARLKWWSAPRWGAIVDHHTRFRPGWMTFDVSAVVRGNGTYAFALTTKGHRRLTFASSEGSQEHAPRLVVEPPSGSPTPPPGGGGGAPSLSGPSTTQPPGFTPLSDQAAAAHVRPAAETRSGNATANHTLPTPGQLASFRSASSEPYSNLVTGAFSGTTDEIIQWAAWKWGLDEDVMRAVAVQESEWRQSAVGDGGVSFGLFQVKTQLAGGDGWPGTLPLARDSTAFNADYYGRAMRSCYDGRETWLGSPYRAGDFWGCIGWWFSGDWHDSGAESYVASVKKWLAERTWEQPGFPD